MTLFFKRYVNTYPLQKLQRNCFHDTSVLLLFFYPFLFQAGEFFHTAQRSAVAQPRESEGQQSAEASLESPLLHEQVCSI
jgi:hypothetical protein